MKFPLSLLKKFLETDKSLDELAAKLTAIGLEVESIEDKSKALAPFVVAEVLEAEKHPQADKLRVCKVKAAQGTLQIVCGAPNARAGIKVALANIGTIIPTNGMEIKKAAVRGVESHGMLCSADELGLGTDSAGIIELPTDAKVGESIVDVLKLNDPVIDLAITANRGDCMGVHGIARDLAAAGMGKLITRMPPENKGNAETYSITIQDTDGCLAFNGRVIKGVKNGPSPAWIQHTLTAAGMRPISALVDVTNYLTLAYGRPAHVYDVKKLKGGIVVRKGKGEKLEALNEKTYTLTERDCVIADDSGAIGIGGIMGGSSTAVDENTTDILIELALFNPERIAKTGRALQIDSDARARFERGVDRTEIPIADNGITAMILDMCGGTPGAPKLVGKLPDFAKPVKYDAKAVQTLSGADVSEAKQKQILEALGFCIKGNEASIPPWRHDVHGAADLVEEILRIVGYDAIPMVSLPKYTGVDRAAVNATQVRTANVRRTLAARGLHETYNWGFVSDNEGEAFGGQNPSLHLVNPISEDLSVMRQSLFPHLIAATWQNFVRGIFDIGLFEVGAIFKDTTPTGQQMLATGIRTGLGDGLNWRNSDSSAVSTFHVKADALATFLAMGFDASKAQVTRTVPAWYHPGKSGAITLGKNIIAYFGQLHPGVLKQMGYSFVFDVYAFEVFLDNVPQARGSKRKALTVSDFQSVARDFAFVVDAALPAADLVAAVNKAEKNLLREVTIFDVYTGKNVGEGKKSIAFTVTLQANDRTLTDAEIETVSKAIIDAAGKLGAVLR